MGLLVSGITSLLVFAGMAPANAAVTGNGNGMTLSVVNAQLVNKVAVNVNFDVTCSTANDPDGDSEGYGVIITFTLIENVKGTIVSNQGQTGGGINPFATVTCDGTSSPVTVTLLPQNGTSPWYKPGPAFISNVTAATFDSDFDCGPVFTPCGSVNNVSGGVQIKGGAD
jgi:hypothetical protein